VPSMLIKSGDMIEIREGSRERSFFKTLPDFAQGRNAPDWIERDVKKLTGTVKRLPERGEIDANLNEQLVVEFYSR
jgi:small subunit ribosomal protein S4